LINHIALISYAYPGENFGYWPGVERSVQGIAKAFRKFNKEVTVITSFCNGGKKFEETKEGIKILRTKAVRYGATAINLITFTFFIIKENKEIFKNFDVVHSFAGSFIPISKRMLNKKCIYISHLFHLPILSDQPFLHMLQETYMRFYYFFYYKLADAITLEYLPESFEYKEFVKLYSKKDKIYFAPAEGIDTEKFNPKVNCEEIKKKYGDKIILAMGPFRPDKGYRYLIKAIPLVLREINDAKFLFVGSGYDKILIENFAKKYGYYNKNIFLTGFIKNNNDIPKYYAAAYALIFPALREGMPLIPLEAMACGTPVISSDLPITRYEIGNAGLFFPPRNYKKMAECIIKILQDENLRNKLSIEAIKRINEKFSWESAAKRLLEVYEKVYEDKFKR